MNTQAKLLKRDQKVIFREEDDLGLLFHPDTGKINILNSTGKFIWSRLDGKKSKEEIIRELTENFELADAKEAAEDFDQFLSALRQWGVMEGCINSPCSLTSVCFGITSKCNFSCKHCLNRNLEAVAPDMTLDELFGVIDQLAQGGVKSVSIFGGEPLCHPEFKAIVEYFNQYPISLSLNTNATLIDREMALWLKAHKITGATVSFDGSKAEIMDAMRGAGAFEKCLKGIEALVSEGLSVLLSVTLNKINYQDVGEMVLLGKKLKASAIRFNHVFFSGNAPCFLEEIYLTPEEEKQAIARVWQAKEEFGNFISGSSSYLCQKRKLEEVKNYQPKLDKIMVPACGAARSKCAIRADAFVSPCEIIWEVKAGNLREKSLKEIWQDSSVMSTLRKPLELDLSQIPECQGCLYQYLCFIGHRCYPYYYPGGIKNRSLYCWLKKEKGF